MRRSVENLYRNIRKTDLNLNLFLYYWKTTSETVKPIFKPQPSFLKNTYIFGVFVDSSRAFNLLQISPHLEVLLFATCYCLLFGGVFIQNCLIFFNPHFQNFLPSFFWIIDLQCLFQIITEAVKIWWRQLMTCLRLECHAFSVTRFQVFCDLQLKQNTTVASYYFVKWIKLFGNVSHLWRTVCKTMEDQTCTEGRFQDKRLLVYRYSSCMPMAAGSWKFHLELYQRKPIK